MLGVPSTLVTLKVLLALSPTFKLSKVLLAVNVQAPAASITRVPLLPTIVAGVKLLSGLSTSVLVKVPLLVKTASVSVKATTSLLTVAASLLPLMVTLMVCTVPSTLVTLKVSLTLSPTFKASTVALLLSTV